MTSDTNHSGELLTEAEVAGILKMTIHTLRNWRVRSHGPPFIRISGRSIRYRRSDVEEWIEEQASRPL